MAAKRIYLPRQATIRKACEKIREAWSDATHEKRAPHLKPVVYTFPEIHNADLGPAFGTEERVEDAA